MERAEFARLQSRLAPLFRKIFSDVGAPRTVLVVPSLSLDAEVMSKIRGVHHYEERMLCLLLLLRMPRTRVIYVTSLPIAESVVDYYLHLLPGVPSRHARQRLTLMSCDDGGSLPLSAKALARPRMLQRLRAALGDVAAAHMTCFTVGPLERRLAVALGIPIYGCDPDLLPLGSKSGGRRLMREAGVPVPDGAEDIADAGGLAEGLVELKHRNSELRRAVVKLNEGFSGEGNATFDFTGAPDGRGLGPWVRERLPLLAFEASSMDWTTFEAKIEQMGAVVEAFIAGAEKRSPSAQYRVNPLGQIERISTHDQLLGGRSGQVFQGCRFPADPAYRLDIQAIGLRAAEALRDAGVIGRFGVDFLSVPDGAGWRHHGIEINLRKGGTTHPFLMLQFLTDGRYDPATGEFLNLAGRACFYEATDNLQSPAYRGLAADDLVDIAVANGLHFHAASQEGVVFHLMGALSEFGKAGLVAVAGSPRRAAELYAEAVAVLDREATADQTPPHQP